MVKKNLIGLSIVFTQACCALDSYDPITNQLTIPNVDVAGKTYTDVVIKVADVVRVSGGTPSGLIDVYNPSTNQLSIPSVVVNGTTHTNVLVTVGQVVSVGTGFTVTVTGR
jgi:hypothetical protein